MGGEEKTHTPPPAQAVTLTIIAQDPQARLDGEDGPILKAAVRIPAEHLEPGPRGARFHVVDYDPASGEFQPPAVLDPEHRDDFEGDDVPDAVLCQDPTFRAQNVYAIAARTLAEFEAALGRRLAWGFPGHHLFLVPRAFPEANAYYNPEDGAIYFGFIPAEGGDIQAALSHDIIAHETTHAILDGLRPRFIQPALPDQDAFHEALADIVALLSVFSLPGVVERLLGKADRDGRIGVEFLTAEALSETPLFGLAEEFGMHIPGGHGSALRRSVELDPGVDWRNDEAFEEPHRRGEILVAAMGRTLLGMWTERLPTLTAAGKANRARVVEDGAKAAAHLLRMMIRAIDYLPSAELEFEDVLDAVLRADEIVAPDDEHGYRDALRDGFAAFDIEPAVPGLVEVPGGGEGPRYERLNFTLLRGDRDEVSRFIWENADILGIDRRFRLQVDSVRPAMRVGPDGLIVGEVIIDFVQSVEMTARELARAVRRAGQDVALPAELTPEGPLQLSGGGTIVFDQFGRAKLCGQKPLADWERQGRRLQYLVRRQLRDRQGRFGFRVPVRRGQRFAAMHAPDQGGENW